MPDVETHVALPDEARHLLAQAAVFSQRAEASLQSAAPETRDALIGAGLAENARGRLKWTPLGLSTAVAVLEQEPSDHQRLTAARRILARINFADPRAAADAVGDLRVALHGDRSDLAHLEEQ